MGYIRIDEHVANHPKFIKAGPRACWLYVCALAYCQQHLTDGFIPREAIPRIGVKFGANSLAIRLKLVGLLDEVDGGFAIHDYLHFNDSRHERLTNRAELSQTNARNGRKGAQARWRRHREALLAQSSDSPASSKSDTHSEPIASFSITRAVTKKEKETSVSLSPSSTPTDPFTDELTTQRAGRFVERYQALYQQHRKGARYALRPARDYAAAVTLCHTWSDDAHLEKLAVMFLNTDHKFAVEGSRTIPQFLALASWLDSKLADFHAEKHA